MRLSHSAIDVFNSCKRWYYYKYIEKIPVYDDMRYARRGNVFHNLAEWILKDRPLKVQLKVKFDSEWVKYKLNKDFNDKKEETFQMVLNFYDGQPKVTSTEFKIYTKEPNFVCYIDAIDTENNKIYDWKTSTHQNKSQYRDQLGRYAYFYWKRFDMIPTCEAWFVKYSDKINHFTFTEEELLAYEQEIIEINKYIESNKHNIDKFPWCVDEGKNFGFFHPYKNLFFDRGDLLVYNLIITGETIYVQGKISDLLLQGLDKTFSYELPAAHFIKQATAHQWDGVIHLFNTKNASTMIGFKDRVLKTLYDYGKHKNKTVKVGTIDKRQELVKLDGMPEKLAGVTLRYYQTEAVEKLIRNQIGIVQLPCGSGKGTIIAELIRRVDTSTLCVFTNTNLLLQTKEELKQLLGIDCGVIGMGESDIQQVTLATYQTLDRHKTKYKDFLNNVQCVVFDEVHQCSCKSILNISKYCTNTIFRFGCSATSWRIDGETLKIHGICGDILYKKSSKELMELGYICQAKCIFIKLKGENDTKLQFQDSYLENIVYNKERNDIIKNLILKHKDEKIMLITKLVEHGKHLKEMIPNSEFIYGKINNDAREETLNKFKDGDINILIGSAQLFSTGVNIKGLNVLINCSGNKSSVQTIQTLGRVLRKSDGKKVGYYYDFIDIGIYHKKASKERINILNKLDFDVEIEE